MTGNRFSALTLVFAMIALLSAGIFGHFAPPPTPQQPATEVARIYALQGSGILTFALLNCIACTLFLPMCCGLSIAMLRMEPRSRFLSLLQCVGGVFATIGPFLASMFLAAAVVRRDLSPEVVASLNDTAVIFIELSTLPALFQGCVIAFAIFGDRSPDPIFPRWLAWVALAWSILAQGGVASVFFESGPLSSTGVIGLVLPMASLFVWFGGAAFVLWRIEPRKWHEANTSLPV